MSRAEPLPIVFSREGVRALDHAAVNELCMPSILLMEHAALSILPHALQMAEGRPGAIVTFCGPGNNGGDGFALGRLLALRGRAVQLVIAADEARISGDARTNLEIARRMGLAVTPAGAFVATALDPRGGRPALVVDALLGTGQSRAPGPPIDEVIRWINAAGQTGVPVLAVDVPTGLDADTGEPLGGEVVRANLTVTLAGMKQGLLNPEAREYSGEVVVGEIGLPREMLQRFGLR